MNMAHYMYQKSLTFDVKRRFIFSLCLSVLISEFVAYITTNGSDLKGKVFNDFDPHLGVGSIRRSRSHSGPSGIQTDIPCYSGLVRTRLEVNSKGTIVIVKPQPSDVKRNLFTHRCIGSCNDNEE